MNIDLKFKQKSEFEERHTQQLIVKNENDDVWVQGHNNVGYTDNHPRDYNRQNNKEIYVDRTMVNQRVSKEEKASEYKSKTKLTNYSRTNTNESKKSFKMPKLERVSFQSNAMQFEL